MMPFTQWEISIQRVVYGVLVGLVIVTLAVVPQLMRGA